MATFTDGMFGAEVVIPGAAEMVEDTYLGDGATTFKKGDLVCINNAGKITDANIGATTAGDIHGMIVNDDYATTAATASEYVTIWKFASDTVIALQLYAAAGADAQQQDLTLGTGYRLKNQSAGIWGIDVANADGSLISVAVPSTKKWFDSDYDADKNFGIGYFSINQSVLEGFAA